MVFTHKVAVRFSDTDMMGHANNSAFNVFLEDARIAFFRSLVAQSGEEFFGRGLIVARVEIDYVRPVFFGDPIEAEVCIVGVGRSSFRVGYVLRQRGEEVARATTVQVAYDYKANASRPLDDVERDALQAQLAG
ncbi:MAG: acyl-CoA thioesterase [Actinomycetes bacterium]